MSNIYSIHLEYIETISCINLVKHKISFDIDPMEFPRCGMGLAKILPNFSFFSSDGYYVYFMLDLQLQFVSISMGIILQFLYPRIKTPLDKPQIEQNLTYVGTSTINNLIVFIAREGQKKN